jgi:hypothetical protein
MNPSIDPAIIAAASEADELAARAEYGAEFRRDLEAFVSREVVEAATVPGRVGLPPVEGTRYLAFADPSGGAQDAFALAIAHAETRAGTQVGVLDYLAARRPPFSPDAVVAEFSAAMKTYGVTTVRAEPRFSARSGAGSMRTASGACGCGRRRARSGGSAAPARSGRRTDSWKSTRTPLTSAGRRGAPQDHARLAGRRRAPRVRRPLTDFP